MPINVSVIGAGSWGPVLAKSLADNGHRVLLWARREESAAEINDTRCNGRYLPGVKLPRNLEVTGDLQRACEHGPLLLLVDDNADTRQVLSMLLAGLGYRTHTASGGHEALELANETVYDLILMDCSMPGLDGWTTTTLLRTGAGPSRAVPVLGLSGHATSEARDRGLDAGMNEHLAKPIRIEQLRKAVDRWIGEPGREPDRG